jgi:hypothetical protein
MSTLQIVAVVIAAVLILSSFVDLGDIKSWLSNKEPTPKPVKPIIVDDNPSISSLVGKWEVLKNACDEAGFKQASDKLLEVFPLLAVKEESNVKA